MTTIETVRQVHIDCGCGQCQRTPNGDTIALLQQIITEKDEELAELRACVRMLREALWRANHEQ